MLAIFSIPKPFAGHVGVIQRNALQSWLLLRPGCEIILCGDDAGVGEAAREFGVRHLPDIRRNDCGTPLLSSAFEQVERTAQSQLLCYVNADIILLSDFVPAIRQISAQKFLMLGQRWDLDVNRDIDYGLANWESTLRNRIRNDGELHPPAGSDYFVFLKGTMGRMLDFPVGRAGWDNWFIYRARSLGLPVIDATEVITIVHQNHDYAHVPRGNELSTLDWVEVKRNYALSNGGRYIFVLDDATHRLTQHGLVRALDDRYLIQRVRRQATLRPASKSILRLGWKTIGRLSRLVGLAPVKTWREFIYRHTR